MTGDLRRTGPQAIAAASISGLGSGLPRSLPPWAAALVEVADLPGLLDELTVRTPAELGFRDAALLLQDPEFEIARLLADEYGDQGAPPRVHRVDSLLGLAPQTASLRRPWVGRFAAADHGLLLPGASGVERLAILPLGRAGRVRALLCLGAAGASATTADSLEEVAALATLALEAALDRLRLTQVGFDDPLTGWHRERYLWARLREELARSARADAPVALLAIDVRGFGAVNAALGRHAGDRVLRELTARIEVVLRESDSTVRLLGDRFMLLLPGTGADGAARVVDRLLDAVEGAPFDLGDGRSVPVRIAIGFAATVAVRDMDLKSASERLHAEALVALARAKQR